MYLLKDLCVPFQLRDDQYALHIAADPTFHELTKHIRLDYHIVREKAEQGLIKFLSISTCDQLTDISW